MTVPLLFFIVEASAAVSPMFNVLVAAPPTVNEVIVGAASATVMAVSLVSVRAVIAFLVVPEVVTTPASVAVTLSFVILVLEGVHAAGVLISCQLVS